MTNNESLIYWPVVRPSQWEVLLNRLEMKCYLCTTCEWIARKWVVNQTKNLFIVWVNQTVVKLSLFGGHDMSRIVSFDVCFCWHRLRCPLSWGQLCLIATIRPNLANCLNVYNLVHWIEYWIEYCLAFSWVEVLPIITDSFGSICESNISQTISETQLLCSFCKRFDVLLQNTII